MSNNTVSAIYSGVIKDVIANVRKDFEDSGIDESVLMELERIWENKIKSAKVAPWEANGLTGEDHGQNVNGSSGSSLYSQPTQPPPSELMKFQTQYDTQAASLPSRAVSSMHTNHNNDISGSYIMKNNKYTIQNTPASVGVISSSDISNRSVPINSQDVNVPPSVDQKIYNNPHIMRTQQDLNLGHLTEKLIPRDPREASTNSSPQALPEFETRVEPPYADNDDINSDLDDSEEDETNADNEETQNIILCLYDKVTRTKNKWKCQLKDGIVSVNGRDYLFQKGNGDFEF